MAGARPRSTVVGGSIAGSARARAWPGARFAAPREEMTKDDDAVPLTGDLDATERDARVAAALRSASDEIGRLPLPDRQI